MYGLNGSSSNNDNFKKIMENIDEECDFKAEDEDQTREDDAALIEKLGIEAEDVHGATKIVLQRQFFEAIVRAAYIKYQNDSELPTLAEKLDHMFKHKLLPNAGKTKTKSSDEEKTFKLSETIMEEYPQLHTVFEYFGRSKTQNNLQKDNTLSVSDLFNMFKKAKILDCDRISTPDFIDIVEKYHANGQGIKLCEKLSDASFKSYCKTNASMFKVN